MEYIEDTPSYRKVAPIKIPPKTDKKINPEKIFEGGAKDPKKPKFLQTIRGEGYVLWVE